MKKTIFLLLLFMPVLGNAQVIREGLVGYWPFNDNANDESGNGYHGEVKGAELVSGKDNGNNTSYLLSKNKYIEVGDLAAFDFGDNEFSISVWIKKLYANTGWNSAFICKWNNGGARPGTNEWSLNAGEQANDAPNFLVEMGDVYYRTENDENLVLNQWYHLVAIRKTTSIEIYVDGVLKSSVEIPALPVNNVGRSLDFGKFGGVDGAGTYYNRGSVIDEAMIFNRTLSHEEIQTLYGGPPEGAVPDIVEHQALVDFYNSTDGHNWADNSNWLQGNTIQDMATWYGVSVENGDITELSLAVNDLKGEIPPSIGNLKKLEYLHLGANEISGSIPAQIGNLIELKRLHLTNNNLAGYIPESIVNLSSLTHLYLQLNNLKGSIPANIGNLNDLKYLYLSDNNLTGPLPLSFVQMKSLRISNLNNNFLTGEIPDGIGNLTELAQLNLSNNALTGSIPLDITNCVNLKTLALNYNNLSGQIPRNIGNLSQLEKLYIRGNSLTGTIPVSIGRLANLKNLMIDGNELTGTIPESLGNCKELYYLYVHSNQLTGCIPASLGNLSKLWHFYVGSNQLTGELPETLGGMTNLTRLYLPNNGFTGTLPSSLANLKKLQKLTIPSNQFEGDIPAELNTLENLTDVTIYNNNFTSLPDFSAHPNREQMTVLVYRNQIKFKDLEKNFTEVGSPVFSRFSYHTQTPLPGDTLAFASGQSTILDTQDNAPHNNFQWQKLENGKWVNMLEATNSTLQIAAVDSSSFGSYRCRITNDWVTNLTIYSRTFVVQVTSEYWSVANGNWTTDRIWSTTKGGTPITGYPQGESRVFIVGNKITLSDSLSCGPIEVIVENAEASLTVDGAEVTVQGDVKLTKLTEGYPGNIKVVNGGRVVPVE